MITQDVLKHYLNYDPVSGNFTWKNKVSSKTVVGRIAGTVEVEGYLVIGIFKKKYKAHRLAYLYMTGEFPKKLIDHIDRNPLNNSWSNLRDCDDYLNSHNQLNPHKHNKTGYLGVSKTAFGKYVGRIVVNKEQISSKYFETAKEAHEWYLAMKIKHHEYCPDEIKLAV